MRRIQHFECPQCGEPGFCFSSEWHSGRLCQDCSIEAGLSQLPHEGKKWAIYLFMTVAFVLVIVGFLAVTTKEPDKPAPQSRTVEVAVPVKVRIESPVEVLAETTKSSLSTQTE